MRINNHHTGQRGRMVIAGNQLYNNQLTLQSSNRAVVLFHIYTVADPASGRDVFMGNNLTNNEFPFSESSYARYYRVGLYMHVLRSEQEDNKWKTNTK